MSNSTAKPAAPFGLKMGLKAEEMHFDMEEVNPGVYVTNHPPKPHSTFSSYVLRVAPVSGLYWVKGISDDIDTDSCGSMLRSKADNMIERLGRIYGSPEIVSFSTPGTIWEDPEDFMMGMVSNEIHFGAKWSKVSHKLPEGLDNIFLGINAKDSNSGHMVIEYEFNNNDQGEKEVEEAEDDAL